MKSNSRYQASHVNCLPPEIDRPPAAGFREDPTLQNPKDSQSSKRAARIARKQTEISIKGADRRFKRSARVQRATAGALPHSLAFQVMRQMNESRPGRGRAEDARENP